MIRALLGAPRPIAFSTYEIDFASGRVLVCDARSRRVRVHRDVTDFLDYALRGGPSLYLCHEGGRYQIQPVLLAAHAQGVEGDGTFYQGSVSRLALRRRDGKTQVQLLDTSGLLRGTLAEVAALRGEDAPDDPAGRARLTAVLLQEAQRILVALGSKLRPTVASAAAEVFRRVYLQDDFETDSNLNRRMRAAYYGGRTEVHRRRLPAVAPPGSAASPPAGGDSDGAVSTLHACYDLNSAYGAAMARGPIPGRLLATGRTLTENCIARVRVRVPECVYPPLPYRTGGGTVYYPVGTWGGADADGGGTDRHAWYVGAELRHAMEHGAEVLEVYEALAYEDWYAPGTFASDLYARREASSDPFERTLLKGLIQGLAGKLAQHTGYERLVCHPKKLECPHDGAHASPFGPLCYRALRVGVYVVTDPDRPAATSHVPAAAAVTALARVALNEGAYACLARGLALGYLATDALYVGRLDGGPNAPGAAADAPLRVGTGLGAWRLARAYREAEFWAQGWYRLDDAVTAAGVPDEHATRAGWDGLVHGESVDHPVPSSVRETLGASQMHVAWRRWQLRRLCVECQREVQGEVCAAHPWADVAPSDSRPKRAYRSDGSTDPWAVDVCGAPWRRTGPSGARVLD